MCFLLSLSGESQVTSSIKVGCTLFDSKGLILLKVPGVMCAFLPSGDYVSASNTELSYVDKSSKVIWKRNGFFHHQLKIDSKQKKVAVLSANINTLFDSKLRTDTVQVYELATGKLIHEMDIFNYLNEFFSDKNLVLFGPSFQKEALGYDIEFTHLNSLSEIPRNALEFKNPVFAKGNWIVNLGHTKHFAVFDQDFKKLLWKKSYSRHAPLAHDVRLNKRGEIEAYMNKMLIDEKVVTAVLYIDPLKEQPYDVIKRITPHVNGSPFYQPHVGGFQELPNRDMLISVFSQPHGFQVGLYNAKSELQFIFSPLINGRDFSGLPFQEAQVINASSFLARRVK